MGIKVKVFWGLALAPPKRSLDGPPSRVNKTIVWATRQFRQVAGGEAKNPGFPGIPNTGDRFLLPLRWRRALRIAGWALARSSTDALNVDRGTAGLTGVLHVTCDHHRFSHVRPQL
jgi:hypothetical protein